MILPIYAIGQPVLKKMGQPIDKDYPNLKELIENMWETMYNAEGVGLAAPQIGLAIRMFMIDTAQLDDGDGTGENGMKQCFINAQKVEEGGKLWDYEEGCLSIPGVYLEVTRPEAIEVSFKDENGRPQKLQAKDLLSRVIQHEMDHLSGVMFVDRVENDLALTEELKKKG